MTLKKENLLKRNAFSEVEKALTSPLGDGRSAPSYQSEHSRAPPTGAEAFVGRQRCQAEEQTYWKLPLMLTFLQRQKLGMLLSTQTVCSDSQRHCLSLLQLKETSGGDQSILLTADGPCCRLSSCSEKPTMSITHMAPSFPLLNSVLLCAGHHTHNTAQTPT